MAASKKSPKVEMFKSKSAMKKHEKSESPKMAAMEKKMGEKDVVKKGSTKKKGY